MISIIIPAHKEKHNLACRITELLSLEHSNKVEVLVALSPNSPDDFGREKCPNVTYISCTKKGRAVQMNQASVLAKGDILVFLHADVKPPKTFLSDIDNAILQGQDAGFFSYKFDKDSLLLRLNASFTGKDGVFTGGGDQCLFIKKSVFEKLGRFNEEQVLMEDFEFFKRMKKNKVPYTIVKSDLVVSARKYESNSYVRVNLSNLLLVMLFNMGCSSKKLKSLHDKLLRTPYNG
ncbi:MAG: glycosyltransferase [Maribacter sp.]